MGKVDSENVLFIPAVDILVHRSEFLTLWHDGSVWPDQVVSDRIIYKKAKSRLDLFRIMNMVYSSLRTADMELSDAIDARLVKPDRAIAMYEQLAEFLLADTYNSRLVLYLPLELIPFDQWRTSSVELVVALRHFCDAYMQSWFSLLSQHDIRASFVDGDIPEPELRTGPLPMVCKAAHLAPFLVLRGLLYCVQVITLIMDSKDEILRNSLADAIMVISDLGELKADDLELMSNSGDKLLVNLATIIRAEYQAPKSFAVPVIHDGQWLDNLNLEVAVSLSVIYNIQEYWLANGKPEARAVWEAQREIGKLIKRYAGYIAFNLDNGHIKVTELQEFMDTCERPILLSMAINGLRIAVEDRAKMDVEYAQTMADAFASQLVRLAVNDTPEVVEALQMLRNRWSRFGLVRGGRLFPVDDEHALFEQIGQRQQLQLGSILAMIRADKQLSQHLLLAMLICGSQSLGYSNANSDFDLAVFFKPGTDIALRDYLHHSLVVILRKSKLKASVIDFWLEADGANWLLQDFEEVDTYLGDNSRASHLLSGSWFGDWLTINDLFNKLLPNYLLPGDREICRLPAKQFILSQLERNVLQYRLLHYGYSRLYPERGGISTRNSQHIDADCSFYDSGYRWLASKLFIKKLFLP
ncbi:MAG: hypothetical protein WCO55_03685 [Candidatus Falkowbacteria bacterium]